MRNKKYLSNLIFYCGLMVIVFTTQFILAGKHLEYGFYIDDWYTLAWYTQVVANPVLDIVKAWNEIGPHNLIHTYYIGLLFEVFKFDYPLYHILNTLFKVLATLSFFPVIYILFKNRFLALLATLIYAIHFSPFGVIFHVIGGETFLMTLSMNLFFLVYIYASQKHILSNIKVLFVLLILFLTTAIIDVTRFYPVMLSLPLLELINFWVNRSSTNPKAIIFRLFFLYSPFIILLFFSFHVVLAEVHLDKFIYVSYLGNFQRILTIFASFGSIFIPQGPMDQLTSFSRVGVNNLYQDWETFLNFLLFRFLIISYPILVIMGFLVTSKPNKFILRSLFFSICFFILAFMAANHWMYLDPKLKDSVEPVTYFIPALFGLFIFSSTISFFVEWVNKKENIFLLILGIVPIFSLLYVFLTWILDNSVFMGVHAYLNIPALGSSLYLATFLYLACKKLLSGESKLSTKFIATLTIIYFSVFLFSSIQQIDKYFSFWLKNGFAAFEQKQIHRSFWKEMDQNKSAYKNPLLIYVDSSQDYNNGYFIANSFVWNIPAMLAMQRGVVFDPNGNCKIVIYNQENFEKIRVEMVNDKLVIIQNNCGYDLTYAPEDFYSFKLINRHIVPNRSEMLKKLGIE